jgi:1-acyl-sn-glycerol-3-phosphate acyltransferase
VEEKGNLLMNSIPAAAQSDSAARSGILRASLYFFLICFYTTVLGIPCLLIALFSPRSELSYWFILFWARLLLRTCGVRVTVSGQENLPRSGSFILMSTHNSHFDIPVLIREVPKQFRIVAKKSLFKIPIFGWIMSAAGYVSVDRDNRSQAFSSLDKAAEMVREGMPLLIFPEGTRSPDGRLGEFKKGGFMLALKAGAPIIPVVIDGTYHVLPKSTWHVNPGPVKVVFGKAIDTTEFSYETRALLMETVRRAMLEIKAAEAGMEAAEPA